MADSFWNLSKSCKWDVIRADRHIHIIHGAMCDPETGIEPCDHDFLLYGEEEALLLKEPASPPLRLALSLYHALCCVLRA